MPRVPDPDSLGSDTSRDPAGNHAADTSRTEQARSRPGIGEQFAEGLPLSTALPGPALAKTLSTTTGAGLAGLSDDALAGYLGACQKIAAWAAALLLDGIAEYADRRPDDATPRRAAWHAAAAKTAAAARAAGQPADPPAYGEFLPDELSPVLRLAKSSAERQADLGLALRYRLHATRAALLAGQIDATRAQMIAAATETLSPAQAAEVEALILGLAGQQTYAALGTSLGKAVLKVDPDGAVRRRERAEKRARVERFREYDGTGALAGRNLPPGDTLAADQALTALALDLRAAGLDGPLDYLRATALIDQITGRDSRPDPGATGTGGTGDQDPWDDRDDWPGMDQWILDQTQHDPAGPASDTDTGNDSGPDDSGPDDSGPDDSGPGDSEPEDSSGTGGDGEGGGGGSGGGGGGTPPPQPSGPARPGGGGTRIAALINLTLPLTTLLDLGITPGDAGPFGPLDPAATRDLARTAATHPDTRWCLTITDRHGHPTAHGCARGPQPWAGLTPRHGPRQSSPGPDPPPDPNYLIARFLTGLKITLSPIAQQTCDHHDAEPGYTPSRKLRHKIHTRTPTCSYWGCRRPAQQCDDDHTTAWDRGGLTCECNLSPLCRRHHRMKQREGWTLTQPRPGIMTWQTPGGRQYVTTPAQYTS